MNKRLKWYVGNIQGVYARESRVPREAFRSANTPTSDMFTRYGAVVGPFRTRRAAVYAAVVGPLPLLRAVSDYEKYLRENESARTSMNNRAWSEYISPGDR